VMLPHIAGLRPRYAVSARSVAINALSHNRREALKFVKFLASKEYSQIVNEGVDALPGNPQFANVGLQEGEPALSELEMHRNTIKTLEYGHQLRRSPFLLTSDVGRVLSDGISRIESDASLPVAAVLAGAQEELERLMQRNLDRDPMLREKYKQLTGSEKVIRTQSVGAQQ
jgi:ABC-type glycerol-3-phosphate transport system substrate-binding protein